MTSPQRPRRKRKTIYFAGPLFDLAHLKFNRELAQAAEDTSNGRYRFVLPQNLDVGADAKMIRDADLRELLQGSQGAVFVFDGTEIDSGTVVEFVIANLAAKPSVVLRTDFRGGGDQGGALTGGDPWNLMLSNWPLPVLLVRDMLQEVRNNPNFAIPNLARDLVNALDAAFAKERPKGISAQRILALAGAAAKPHAVPARPAATGRDRDVAKAS